MTLPSPDPSTALTTSQLCDEVARLARTERETESLLCLHLAELADRFERDDPALGAFCDVYQLARARFGMSVRRVRERVRVGRALRELPRTEQAFVEGEIGYTQVREVTRVATPESEGEWLQSACELPLRALERRVAEASTQDQDQGEEQEQAPGRSGEPAGVDRTSPEPTEVDLVLPAATWALVQRAMEGARRRSGSSLSDAQALEAVARDALTQQAENGATGHDRGGAHPDEQGGEPFVTPGGHDQGHHPDEQGGEPSVTPGGHDQGRDAAPLRSDPESDHDAGAGGAVGSRLLSLLSLTGGRGAWHPDRLCQESGFSPSAVLVALLELVLAHQVRMRADGCYERVLPRRGPYQPRLACQAPRSAPAATRGCPVQLIRAPPSVRAEVPV